MLSSIDIHSTKLVEWTASRFKLNKDWAEKVMVIREKISNALLDMPESEEIKNLLLGTYINYFHCTKILDILRETELSTKNIFGQYSSKRIKDWQEIIKLYEQNHYFLIDCSQILNQFVSFDIPALKKAIEKNNKTINDSFRKEKEYQSTVQEANINLKNLFQKYSLIVDTSELINTESIRSQLRASVDGLKPLLEDIENKIHILRRPSELYNRFVKETLQNNNFTSLTMLSYLMAKGNTTVYEWKYDKKPTMTTNIIAKQETEALNEEEISWDCNVVEEDFSVVDFEIEIEGETGETPSNEMLTLLENHETREMILDDLHELVAFFSSCIDETKVRSISILDSIENIEEKWPDINADAVESMRMELSSFMDQMIGKSLIHLLNLKINPFYLDSILNRVEHERSVILKYQNLGSLLKTRVSEAGRENVTNTQQLEALKQQCHTLKGQIENSISKAFSDREVRIIGEISTI